MSTTRTRVFWFLDNCLALLRCAAGSDSWGLIGLGGTGRPSKESKHPGQGPNSKGDAKKMIGQYTTMAKFVVGTQI